MQLPVITPSHRAEKRFQSFTDGAIQGTLLVESYSNAGLRKLASRRPNKWKRHVMELMGSGTNPYWISARAAETLYKRGAIDETEFDRLAE